MKLCEEGCGDPATLEYFDGKKTALMCYDCAGEWLTHLFGLKERPEAA